MFMGGHKPSARGPDTGIGAISERISRCQNRKMTNARGMTGDPMRTDGMVPKTVGSNRIPPGSGNATGERVRTAGVKPTTAERERIEEMGSSISAK